MSETRNKKCRDKHSTRHRCRHGGLCAPVHTKEYVYGWTGFTEPFLSDSCVLLTHAPGACTRYAHTYTHRCIRKHTHACGHTHVHMINTYTNTRMHVCTCGGGVSCVAYRAQLGRLGGSLWGWVL